MNAKHYLIPDYVLDFKCSKCTECCKTDWKIYIDDKTAELYEKIAQSDELFAEEVKNNFKKAKNGKKEIIMNNVFEETDDAELKKDSSHACKAGCSFLLTDGRCSIQKRFGEEALSDTCKIYPRYITVTERGHEIALSFSCPTAAAKLKNKNQIQFYYDPEGYNFVDINGKYDKIGNFMDRRKHGKTNYFDIEELLIDIMQLKEMDIETRLILTGIVIDKIKDGDLAGLHRYIEHLEIDLFKEIKSISTNHTFNLKFIKEAIDLALMFILRHHDTKKLLVTAYDDLEILNESIITTEKIMKFVDGYNKYYRPFYDNISHIYENYFVNYIFSKRFYNMKYIEAYFLMVLFFILIRFFVVCLCIKEERKVDEDMIIEVIRAIDRSIGHNDTYYKSLLKMVKTEGYTKLPYIISLIIF